MSIIKKISILVFSLVLTMMFVACSKEISSTTTSAITTTMTETTSTEDPDLVMLKQIAATVLIENADNITEDFSLLAAYGSVSITWTSLNPTVASIATVATTEGSNSVYLVTVNPFTMDTVVVLQATFTYNEETYTKLYSITVKEPIDDGSYSLVSELHEEAIIDDIVTFSGYVSVIYKGGYVVTDTAGNSVVVYFTNENTVMIVSVGDHVTITGKYGNYHTSFQIEDPSSQVVNSSDNNITLTPTVLENSTDLLNVDSLVKTNHGKVYTITATPVLSNKGDLVLYQGETQVAMIYYNSPVNSITALEEYLTQEVTITVMYYTDHTENGIIVLFYGNDEDIEAKPLTLEQQFAIDIALLDVDLTISNALEFPILRYAEYGVIDYSSLADYLSLSGDEFVVTRPTAIEGDVTGAINVRIMIGEEYRDVVINVTIKAETNAVVADLFISEYIEGGGFNKLIELYNGTGASVNLSEYTLELYSNGAATASFSYTLSGTLLPGQTIALYNSQATADFKLKADLNVENNSVINFNGDDAIVLKHNGVIIDGIGQVGVMPATKIWGDMTLVRKPFIITGRTDVTSEFDPTVEWIVYPSDTFTYIGTHVID